MMLDAVLSRARYLAIALPLFAVFTTVHGGCTQGTFYYGTYTGGYRTRANEDTTECVVYRTGESGTNGYFGPCVDDGYAYGGYGGNAP